jgi:hypothetical protein
MLDLEASPDNSDSKDPKFCVGLQSGVGWEQSVIVTNQHTQATSTVLIDYDHLPIRCRYCGDTAHCLRDCSVRPGPCRAQPQRPMRAPTQAPHKAQAPHRSPVLHRSPPLGRLEELDPPGVTQSNPFEALATIDAPTTVGRVVIDDGRGVNLSYKDVTYGWTVGRSCPLAIRHN